MSVFWVAHHRSIHLRFHIVFSSPFSSFSSNILTQKKRFWWIERISLSHTNESRHLLNGFVKRSLFFFAWNTWKKESDANTRPAEIKSNRKQVTSSRWSMAKLSWKFLDIVSFIYDYYLWTMCYCWCDYVLNKKKQQIHLFACAMRTKEHI